MNGVMLDSLDETIFITDIIEKPAGRDPIALPLAGTNGSRLQSNYRRSKTVLIRLMIREYDVTKRKAVYDKVVAWAQEGRLEINDRPGQSLQVKLDEEPEISALKWTESLTLSLTAWEHPQWEG
jgi:hypothetical protein